MKPQVTIEKASTPDGKEIVLYERDKVFTIRVNGLELMSSRVHGSEEDMATLALADLRAAEPHVLVGGLGMGLRFSAQTIAKLVPGAGNVVSAGVAGAGTTAMGQSAIRYFLRS